LEVGGDTQVDGNFSVSGSVMVPGVGQLIWAPNNGTFYFSSRLGALPSSTTGSSDTAVGDGALASNTTGVNNTAIGQNALQLNTSGGANTATGVGALH
jgi:hypothetical protein